MESYTLGSRLVRVPSALLIPIGSSASGPNYWPLKLIRNGMPVRSVVDADVNSTTGTWSANAERACQILLRAGNPAYFNAPDLDSAQRRALIAHARRVMMPAVALVSAGSSVDYDELIADGFDRIVSLKDDTRLELLPNGSDWRGVSGPFLVIADLHNCFETLMDTLAEHGFDEDLNHPDNLFPIFVGDVIDKGGIQPGDSDDVASYSAVRCLRWLLRAQRQGKIGWVMGNHERKLARYLASGELNQSLDVAATVEAILAQPDSSVLVEWSVRALPRLPIYLRLDDGHQGLFVVHAGICDDLIGRDPSEILDFCLYTHSHWARSWKRPETVCHGHVVHSGGPLVEYNGGGAVIGLDTGCYQGGGLSTYRSDTQTLATTPTADLDFAADSCLIAAGKDAETLSSVG